MEKSNFFEYEIREDDPSLKMVRNEEKFFGYEESKPLEYDDDYLSLWDPILSDRDIERFSNFSFGLVDKNYLRDSLAVYDELGITLHNIDLTSREVKCERDFENIDYDRLVKLIQFTNPREIPIHLHISNGGKVVAFSLEGDMNKIVAFKHIDLPLVGNKAAACFYLHEIAHTQLMGPNWGMKSLLNEEVIPNFMDQVASIRIDQTGRVLRNIRYNDATIVSRNLRKAFLSPNLSFAHRLKSDTFVQSVLEATNLANIYFEASPLVKREMMGDVDRIFNGDMFTEDMLSKYESGIDNVPKDVKVFKKI